MKAKGHAIGRLIVSTISLGALALGITGCDNRLARMEENQIRLQAMVAANARQLATVSSQVYVNNNEVQEGIQKLDRNDQGLGTGIATVQNKQDVLHETVTSANQAMDKRMATLDENQRLLRDGVSQVAGVTQRTASDVTAVAREQATLHQMVQSGRQELGNSIAAVAANQEKTRTDIGQLQQAEQRMAEQLVALAASQDRIYSGLEGLNKFVQAVAKDVTGVSQGQTALHQTLNEHRAAFAEKSAILEQNQRNLQTAVDGIAGGTKTNTEGIAALAAGQTALQETLGANHKIVTGQVAAVIENQQGLQAGINGLNDRTGQAASQLAALTTGQDAIRETLNTGNGAVAAKLMGLSETQTGLQNNLSGLNQKADTIVGSVTTIRDEQASLQETLKASQEAAKNQMTQLSSGQQQIQGQLDVLTATTGQTALDVMAVGDNQSRLGQATQAGVAALSARTDKIDSDLRTVAVDQSSMYKALKDQGDVISGRIAETADNQKQLRGSLDAVAATATQTATDVKAAAVQQATMQQALQNRNEATARRIAGLADNQGQMQSSLDAVMATTGQTALDVIGMTAGQDALTQNLQSHNAAVGGQIADLVNGQQQTQSGLDTVIATAGQTALDMIDLSNGQARLARAVQTDRQELAARLTELVQGQQQWAQRLDTAQANVQTITASIAALEQHLTKLQGSLQPSLDGLTSQLGTNGQGRAQFETKVNQDIQAIVDAVSQLRQQQASLADEMQQIQNRTLSQTQDIITAIQQLKQSPVEVKVSDAATTTSDSGVKAGDSGTKLESSVAEAEAK